MEIFDEDIFDDELYKLVVAIVQRGYSDEVVFAAKSAGAKGAVILSGKGVGESNRKFFGFKIDPENEVVMLLVKEEIVVPVMKAIYFAADYQSSARGLVFALPVSYVTGMTHIKEDDQEPAEGEDKEEKKEENIEDKEPDNKEEKKKKQLRKSNKN